MTQPGESHGGDQEVCAVRFRDGDQNADKLRPGSPGCMLNCKMTFQSSRIISFIYRYWYPVAASAE